MKTMTFKSQKVYRRAVAFLENMTLVDFVRGNFNGGLPTGFIPTGYTAAQLIKGIDIREHGSGSTRN